MGFFERMLGNLMGGLHIPENRRIDGPVRLEEAP